MKNQLIKDTIAFLGLIANDKSSPRHIRDCAQAILNSWQGQEGDDPGDCSEKND